MVDRTTRSGIRGTGERRKAGGGGAGRGANAE